jgi:type I restriction-modification system DNA methylase subunit
MLKQKTYFCGICNSKPDQLSHHKSHLDTQKHKDKKELLELKLGKLNVEELQDKYDITNIIEIIKNIETISNEKKLNVLDINFIDNDYMNMLKDNITNETMSISNKDALKDKIHEIHNFLRNNGAGYGMNALKVFNIIYGLKKIEENNLLEKANLKKPDCEFSYLLKLANENKDEQLTELIFGSVLPSIFNSNVKDLIFYKIPNTLHSSVFVYLIKEINKITLIEKSCNVLLSGKIYEYFIGRDESAISELGAYFTDRHIVDYIYKKLQPTLCENGEIGTMIDMFGGSGGFTTGYINYIKEHFNVNWSSEIEKVYHYDMNEDVIKSAGLEFFCLTGVLPNMKHLQYKNSFTDEFVGNDGRTEQKYKYVITNPPYGGDKNNKSEAQIKREKIKEYIKKEILNITDKEHLKRRQKQLKQIEMQEKHEKKEQEKTKVSLSSSSKRIQRFAKKYDLKGTDKEACSLILMMELLDFNGTCIGVLKEGVFFNKTYKELRKTLIENYNVREVISVPQDQFENTSTKTSIIIFDNKEEKTKKVKFSNLTIERYEEDKFEEIMDYIYITESKGDIKKVSDTLISEANKEELLTNNICSLNGKDYNKKEIICDKDYKLVKLGDICNDIFCGKNLSKEKAIEGNYKVFGGGNSSYNHNEYNLEGFNILISRVGNNNISLINEKIYLTDNGFSLKINNENLKKIIGYYLVNKKEEIFNLGNGTAQKVITKTQLKELVLPIPKSEEKIKEWVDKISKPYELKNQKEQELKQLEIEIQNKIKYITENEDCNEVELGNICKLQDGYDFYRNEMDDRKEYIHNENLPLLKIGSDDISDYIKIDKKYEKYLVNKDDIVIGTKGTCGKIRKININKAYHKHGLLKVIEEKINKNFIFYYLLLLLNDEAIEKMCNKSVLSNMKKENLLKMKLKIPKNNKLINNLEPLFNKIEKLQTKIKENEKLYNQFIQELSDDVLPKNQINTELEIINETLSEDKTIIIKKNKKTTKN